MKIILISPKNRTVYNFRGDLVKEIIDNGHEVLVTGPDYTDVDKIHELKAEFVQIPMNKNGTNIFKDIKYLYRLYKLFKKEKPDITLGYTVKPVVYGAIAAKLSGVKNINCMVTGAGYTLTAKTFKAKCLGGIVKTLYKIAFSVANNIIFQNIDDLIEFSDKKLVKKDKCTVVNGSGVNTDWFSPVEPPENLRFFMLSRLLKSKGIIEYLEAAKIVKKKYPNVNFALLGKYEKNMQDAVDKEYIEQYIKEEIIERYEETNDVRPYYAECSIYVLPSYREGTPRTVLEAMSCARPIITTDAVGCRETVINGLNGLLVPIADIDALANAMIWMIENPENLEKMAEASRKIAVDKYDVHKVNKVIMQTMKI